MTDTTPTCPATVIDRKDRLARLCGRPGKFGGYCGFHKSSAEGEALDGGPESRSTPETGSEPAAHPEPERADARSSAEPTTGGEVGDATAAHEAPEAVERPTSPLAPKPTPPRPGNTTLSRGAVRRLQALTTFGYTPRQLAKLTGLSDDSIWWLLTAPPISIQTRTHALIAETFRRLRVTPLTGTDADRARALALAGDWPGPYDWDDIDTDHQPPTRASRKTLDPDALAEAVAQARLEQGDPETVDVDALQDARAEAGRLRVELEQAQRANDTVADAAAAAQGEIDGLRERIRRRDGEILALRDQLAAANLELDQLRTETDLAAQRITELDSITAAHARTAIDYAALPEEIDWTTGTFAPAPPAQATITIKRTEDGRGIQVSFPESLWAAVTE